MLSCAFIALAAVTAPNRAVARVDGATDASRVYGTIRYVTAACPGERKEPEVAGATLATVASIGAGAELVEGPSPRSTVARCPARMRPTPCLRLTRYMPRAPRTGRL